MPWCASEWVITRPLLNIAYSEIARFIAIKVYFRIPNERLQRPQVSKVLTEVEKIERKWKVGASGSEVVVLSSCQLRTERMSAWGNSFF